MLRRGRATASPEPVTPYDTAAQTPISDHDVTPAVPGAPSLAACSTTPATAIAIAPAPTAIAATRADELVRRAGTRRTSTEVAVTRRSSPLGRGPSRDMVSRLRADRRPFAAGRAA